MRKPKQLNPKLTWIVSDKVRSLTPAFYHEELAAAAERELSKDYPNLEVVGHTPQEQGSGFEDALAVLSRETRWLLMSRSNKPSFSALCEGWASHPRPEFPLLSEELER